MRTPGARAASQQRSINLALSARGIAALQSILGHETAALVLTDALPMRGRMIHDAHGRLDSQAYDRYGQVCDLLLLIESSSRFITLQYINSLDRAVLNETLLTLAAQTPNVRVFFKHKVQSIDFDKKLMVARDVSGERDCEVFFDLCIGADGSYSVVRRQLMRVVR
jgi:kynurenine 3-monooxygenase